MTMSEAAKVERLSGQELQVAVLDEVLGCDVSVQSIELAPGLEDRAVVKCLCQDMGHASQSNYAVDVHQSREDAQRVLDALEKEYGQNITSVSVVRYPNKGIWVCRANIQGMRHRAHLISSTANNPATAICRTALKLVRIVEVNDE